MSIEGYHIEGDFLCHLKFREEKTVTNELVRDKGSFGARAEQKGDPLVAGV